MSKKNSLYDMRDELQPSGSANGTHTASMADKDRKRMRRSAYIKMVAMVGIIGAVLAYSSIAWFTQNKENNASGMGVKVGSSPFELKTQGYYGYYDDRLSNDVLKLDSVANGAGGTSGSLTTAEAPCIQWLITQNENTRNYITSNTKNDDRGIRPGTSGELKFWIVPKDAATVNVSFQLKTKAYKTVYKTVRQVENSGSATELYIDPATQDYIEDHIELIENQTDILNYVNSHIMFFKKHNADGTYSDLITPESTFALVPDGNGGYTSTLTFAVENNVKQEQEFSIFWVWPETLAETVLTKNLQSNGKTPVCADTNNEVRNLFKTDPSKYLADFNASVDTDGIASNNLTTDIIKQYYSRLSVEYNNADQNIGDNVGYILLELTALG